MSTTLPDRLLSLADWEALPEDNSRCFELAEGVLVAAPRPRSHHQYAVTALASQVNSQLPAGAVALFQFELLVLDGRWPTVRVPDLMVLPAALAKSSPARAVAGDVVLVAEVSALGSCRLDRVTKLSEYAEAGIPDYWIVDIEPPVSITAFQLADGRYELNAEVDDVLSVTSPAPLRVNVPALLP